MAVSPARTAVLLGAFSLSTFAFVTTETLPIGLLPLIARDLSVSPSAVGLLVSGYALVVVVVTVPLTRLTESVPRRLLLSGLLAVFVLGTVLSAVSTVYWALLGARTVTAIAQAVFWAIVLPTSASLVSADRRGRAVAAVYAGSSLGVVLGVPAGTWLGQATDWRTAFGALSLVGVAAFATVAALLPGRRGDTAPVQQGSTPDRGRYRILVIVTALLITSSLTAYTYVTPFLTEVSGFGAAAVGAVLLVRGGAGLLGVLAVGPLMDAAPQRTMLVVVGAQAAGLALQYVLGIVPWVAVVALALSGAALSAYAAALGARVLAVAPGSVDLASAGTSTAWNVGIMLGALVGAAMLPLVGPAGLPLVAAALGLAAFGVLAAESRLASAPPPARGRSAS